MRKEYILPTVQVSAITGITALLSASTGNVYLTPINYGEGE
jgi:hypothetical protein